MILKKYETRKKAAAEKLNLIVAPIWRRKKRARALNVGNKFKTKI